MPTRTPLPEAGDILATGLVKGDQHYIVLYLADQSHAAWLLCNAFVCHPELDFDYVDCVKLRNAIAAHEPSLPILELPEPVDEACASDPPACCGPGWVPVHGLEAAFRGAALAIVGAVLWTLYWWMER